MKWVYDRPVSAFQDQAIKYRSDIPIKVSDLRMSADQIVPSLSVLLYTINFGEAADSKTEGMVYRPDGWTIGNQLWIVPPCEDDDTVRKHRAVSPLSTQIGVFDFFLAFARSKNAFQKILRNTPSFLLIYQICTPFLSREVQQLEAETLFREF